MPHTVTVGDHAREGFERIADVLPRLRDLLTDEPERRGGWDPVPGSQAELDLNSSLIDRADLNSYLVNHPRAVASLFIRAAADYLAGTGVLVRSLEAMFSPGALSRAAFENALRALYLLDPRVDLAGRAARAMLEDIVGLYRQYETHSDFGTQTDARAWKGELKRFRDDAETAFGDCSWANDPHRWEIGGQRYPRMNELADYWEEWRTAPNPPASPGQARGFYDVLCMYSHPQSFTSRPEAVTVDGVGQLTTDVPTVTKVTLNAHIAVLDVAGLLFSYQGWEVAAIDAIADENGEILRVWGGSD